MKVAVGQVWESWKTENKEQWEVIEPSGKNWLLKRIDDGSMTEKVWTSDEVHIKLGDIVDPRNIKENWYSEKYIRDMKLEFQCVECKHVIETHNYDYKIKVPSTCPECKVGVFKHVVLSPPNFYNYNRATNWAAGKTVSEQADVMLGADPY